MCCRTVTRRLAWLVIPLSLCAPTRALAQSGLPTILKNVGFDQRLNDQVPLDLTFNDDDGRPVKLGDFFKGKPVILALAYFRCPMLCTQVLNGMVLGMRDSGFAIGKEFEVLTVSFDPDDSPTAAAAKKKSYIRYYGNPEAAADWHFLTGRPDSIKRLTDSVGFRYVYDEKSDQFAHAAGILILTPTGRISRYFYDVHYPGRDLRLGLIEASQNKIGSPIDQVLLFCFHYDPSAGKYSAAVLNLVRAGGLLTMLGIASLFVWLLKSERGRRKPIKASDAVLMAHEAPDPLT
jgi:protein SCO1